MTQEKTERNDSNQSDLDTESVKATDNLQLLKEQSNKESTNSENGTTTFWDKVKDFRIPGMPGGSVGTWSVLGASFAFVVGASSYGAKKLWQVGSRYYRAAQLTNRAANSDKEWYRRLMAFVGEISRSFSDFDTLWKEQGEIIQGDPFFLLCQDDILNELSERQKKRIGDCSRIISS